MSSRACYGRALLLLSDLISNFISVTALKTVFERRDESYVLPCAYEICALKIFYQMQTCLRVKGSSDVKMPTF